MINPMWYVYILECSDGSLYTGSTNDVNKRVVVHNSGKGAKYTRARLPVKVVYTEKNRDRSVAAQREAAIKRLTRKNKKQLIASVVSELQ
jgi:predicted GIY-YIG superfamily endonuclease